MIPPSAASPATTTPARTRRSSPRSPQANGGHQISYGEDVYTARLQEVMAAALRRRRRGLPGVQRHRRQRAVPAVDAAPLGRGDLRRDRAHQHATRTARPERVGGLKLLTVADPGRQAHPRADRPAGLGLGRRAPGPAAGRLDHPDHRTRHRLHARRDPGDRRPRPPAGHDAAPRRRPDRERGRQSRRCRCGPSPRDAGVDVLSFGGTKNGLLFGEAIVVLRPGGRPRA